jgi:CelD/BcsL family acetyltransferase involved in cellulose biosynthesis
VPLAAASPRLSSPAAAPHSISPPAGRRPFVAAETFDRIEAARDAWREIAPRAAASPYQDFDFSRLWLATIGAARGVKPLIVVARDAAGEVAALLPLGERDFGPLRFAQFLGGKDANFNLGLFRRGAVWAAKDVAALLEAAARATTPRIDAFLLCNQPLDWQGAPNPLAALPRQASPSSAYESVLPDDFAAWRNAHLSTLAQQKLRRKVRRLERMGPVVCRRAADSADADRLLAAFFAQKSARMGARGLVNAYEAPEARAFIARLADCGLAAGAPTLELHGLFVGDRVVATCGALGAGGRMSCLFLSHDGETEIARSSPGEVIVQAVVRDAIARGFKTFDLGVGEARYKDEACEVEEPLFDSAFTVSPAGRVAACAFLARQRLKRRVKRSPRLLSLTRKLVTLSHGLHVAAP